MPRRSALPAGPPPTTERWRPAGSRPAGRRRTRDPRRRWTRRRPWGRRCAAHAVRAAHGVQAAHAVDAAHGISAAHASGAGHEVGAADALGAGHWVGVARGVRAAHGSRAAHGVDAANGIHAAHKSEPGHGVPAPPMDSPPRRPLTALQPLGRSPARPPGPPAGRPQAQRPACSRARRPRPWRGAGPPEPRAEETYLPTPWIGGGFWTRGYGSIPGPTMRIKPGEKLEIEFENGLGPGPGCLAQRVGVALTCLDNMRAVDLGPAPITSALVSAEFALQIRPELGRVWASVGLQQILSFGVGRSDWGTPAAHAAQCGHWYAHRACVPGSRPRICPWPAPPSAEHKAPAPYLLAPPECVRARTPRACLD